MTTDDRWLFAWAVGYAAIGAASLLVPLYVLTLGADAFVVGLVEALVALAGVPGALIWGRLADRSGRRRVFLLVSLGGTAATLGVIPLLDTVGAVLVATAVLWFFIAAAAPVVTLFVIEGVPESRWDERIGRLNAYQRYGWVAGTVAGAVWTGITTPLVGELRAQQTFFPVCAGAAVVGIPLVRRWLPPEVTIPPSTVRRRRLFRRSVDGAGRAVQAIAFGPTRTFLALRAVRFRSVLSRYSTTLRKYLLATVVFSAGFAAFFAPMPAFLVETGYVSGAVFGLFILSNAASAVVFARVGSVTARLGTLRAQLLALSTRAVVFPAVALLPTLPVLAEVALVAVAFVLVGVTWAVVATTAASLVSRLAPLQYRGEALGLYVALSGTGGAVGALTGGAVVVLVGYLTAFTLASVAVLTSIGVILTGRPDTFRSERISP